MRRRKKRRGREGGVCGGQKENDEDEEVRVCVCVTDFSPDICLSTC